MKAFLHIGTTNTGNQEKQGFLAKNFNKLLNQGFLYPKSLRVANRHWALVDMVLELIEDKNLSLTSPQQVLKALKNPRLLQTIEDFKKEKELHKDKTFIFSVEGCVWEFSSKRHIEILHAILKALGFSEIKLMVYFRDTLDYLNSHCSQDLKNNLGYYSGDFKPQDHPRKYIFDYKWICENYTEVFGENSLIVRLLREDYVGGTLLKDFTYHLGIKWDETFDLEQKRNESFNLLGMEIQKRLNEKDLNGQNFNSLLSISRKHFEGTKEPRLKFKVQKELAKAYVDYFASSNEWVRAKYFPHKKSLFTPINWDDYKENATLKDTKEEDWDKIVDFFAEVIVSKNIIIQNLKNCNKN
ncbi:hypothetical protein CNZW441b_1263 [Campylobacter novaezeelandiae]|uniref:Acyl carrier protein n=1 Tax=Campylobacter novaezeelandiae TaxID=2267891 RepID=A0A4Q9JTD2_9BACT|nr:acyl carrier protein [Campylobacter novaezeelandiae]QWU80559.1 hypothetical protein CNZW441b_1263 [Campylobacter novaezeelandiae]TBR80133.1 acyl carrier protein [Campylobacter novaezeelandiae]